MLSREQVLNAIGEAFGGSPRPAQFVNAAHCCECAEHEDTLQRLTPATISLKEAGNPGWDPICFVSAEGFRYFMPGLCRLALAIGQDSYLDQFLFHLESKGRDDFTQQQKKALLDLHFLHLLRDGGQR